MSSTRHTTWFQPHQVVASLREGVKRVEDTYAFGRMGSLVGDGPRPFPQDTATSPLPRC